MKNTVEEVKHYRRIVEGDRLFEKLGVRVF